MVQESKSFNNVIDLDHYRPIEDIVMRDFNTRKLCMCYYDNDGNLYSYYSNMTDMEVTYVIQTLQDRRDGLI